MTNLKKIANIPMDPKQATQLPVKNINKWVIWQFPEKKSKQQFAAVKPPDPRHQWFPALLSNHGQEIKIFAHLSQTFESPETVLEFLQTSNQS